jgi:NADH dehydrogenase [ubiquinone] 1 alpha subcomplex assembly factor 7
MTATPFSAIGRNLAQKIMDDGPIPVADYMKAVAEAYYERDNVFGRAGDFVTAPEVSQIFGELIGLWCVTAWQQLDQPRLFNLVECGPGRGTLMSDIMRTVFDIAPKFAHSAQIRLIERSAARRTEQQRALEGLDVTWHENLSELPEGPCIIVANEFLDALPIEQFVKCDGEWRERLVDFKDDTFAFAVADQAVAIADGAFDDCPDGSILEQSAAVTSVTREMGALCAERPGIALLIDYGHVRTDVGETLQAVKNHAYTAVLADPGAADITAHVDFAAVAEAARAAGARVIGPAEQGVWLRRIGATVREAQLCEGKPTDQIETIRSGVRRLIEPEHMGTLFKVVALAPPHVVTLAGFETGADPC